MMQFCYSDIEIIWCYRVLCRSPDHHSCDGMCRADAGIWIFENDSNKSEVRMWET